MHTYTTKNVLSPHPLGELAGHVTLDGSFSLHSGHFKENFHDHAGAMVEAKTKFINPAKLKTFKTNEHLRILDVCVGLGYNTACAMEEVEKLSLKLNWWGLELDPRPIKLALDINAFRSSWSPEVLKSLEKIRDHGFWENSISKGQILWGDARQCISRLPKDINFHLIMLDPFSPKHCPELWTKEFLRSISKKLAPDGRLVTYCTAAAVRNTLQEEGLELLSLSSPSNNKKRWSNGTIATRYKKNNLLLQTNQKLHRLTHMEREHLLTRAAIPYRDPSGIDTATRILQRRKQEQESCELESTSSWQRRWLKK
ncbi:MnmC family methyltransferase [Prochlorococcus sp. MIT 1341]|uniref:MnmC family methyltransferase n=1 Tax=Prochlorococcus sp. MIT 1341 TaxID=3096221 RepID=UPI002A75670D|nr:MnmC family methyltransferase [Prochlorococcus sp. MIT 1341]